MTSWAELLTGAGPGEHVVQLYGEDDQLLARNASRYLAEGLRRGDGLVVIATPEHIRAIARHLVEEDAASALEAASNGRLRYLEAEHTLADLLVARRPDETRFRTVIGGAIAGVRARSATGSARAFGEMVGLLWNQERYEDAERLERLWNAVLAEYGCSLFCAYRIDLFDPAGDAAELHSIIGSHHRILAGTGTLLSSGRPRA